MGDNYHLFFEGVIMEQNYNIVFDQIAEIVDEKLSVNRDEIAPTSSFIDDLRADLISLFARCQTFEPCTLYAALHRFTLLLLLTTVVMHLALLLVPLVDVSG